MKELKKMDLNELKKLSRSEMKAIMAGSGSPGSGCKLEHESCGSGSGTTYCCNGFRCIFGTCGKI